MFLYLNQHPRLTDNSSNPVSNILVRKAIAMALDLPGILNASFGSSQYYKLANQLEVPNMYYGGQSVQNTTIPSPEYPQNVTGAKALLTQAGFPNGFTVSLVYQSAGVASAGSGATLKMMQLCAVRTWCDRNYCNTSSRRPNHIQQRGLWCKPAQDMELGTGSDF